MGDNEQLENILTIDEIDILHSNRKGKSHDPEYVKALCKKYGMCQDLDDDGDIIHKKKRRRKKKDLHT